MLLLDDDYLPGVIPISESGRSRVLNTVCGKLTASCFLNSIAWFSPLEDAP